jgi:hypothetical protein
MDMQLFLLCVVPEGLMCSGVVLREVLVSDVFGICLGVMNRMAGDEGVVLDKDRPSSSLASACNCDTRRVLIFLEEKLDEFVSSGERFETSESMWYWYDAGVPNGASTSLLFFSRGGRNESMPVWEVCFPEYFV